MYEKSGTLLCIASYVVVTSKYVRHQLSFILKYVFCSTSDSKLNNFTRVEPILNLLGIPFDTAAARCIMTERHGEATKLMYQLFIALNRKQKAGLTGTAMETMRPAAPAKLDYMKSLIYKEVGPLQKGLC